MRAGNTATASETRQPHRVVAPALTCTRRTYLIVNQSLSCSLLDLTYLISDCSSCLQRFFQASPSRGPARIVSNGMPESDFLSPESISIMKQRSQQWLSPRTAREIRTKKLFWYTMQKKDRPTALMRESVGGAGVTYLIHLAHHILFMAGHEQETTQRFNTCTRDTSNRQQQYIENRLAANQRTAAATNTTTSTMTVDHTNSQKPVSAQRLLQYDTRIHYQSTTDNDYEWDTKHGRTANDDNRQPTTDNRPQPTTNNRQHQTTTGR